MFDVTPSLVFAFNAIVVLASGVPCDVACVPNVALTPTIGDAFNCT